MLNFNLWRGNYNKQTFFFSNYNFFKKTLSLKKFKQNGTFRVNFRTTIIRDELKYKAADAKISRGQFEISY